MKTEKDIRKRIGRQVSFEAPDGYFDELTSRVMSKLDDTPHVIAPASTSRVFSLRPYAYVASCAAAVVGILFAIRAIGFQSEPVEEPILTESLSNTEEEYIYSSISDVITDYEVYSYLADAAERK